jgi:type III secretory pathway component EscU
MTEGNITNLTIILSLTFYISSLTQTAYCTNDCKSSLMVLLVGILGILTEIGAIASSIMDKINGQTSTINNDIGAAFTWLANPIILFSLFIF